MPALNFTKFVDKVESGAKRCTIRAQRKHPIRSGTPLYLYTGMRTKACRLLRQQTEFCREVIPILIDGRRVVVRDKPLAYGDIIALAIEDGFEGAEAFLEYFNRDKAKRGPFVGNIIKW